MHIEPDIFSPQTLGDNELHERSRGKFVYVLVMGDKVDAFTGKKRCSFVLFTKAKVYFYNQCNPPIFRIELNDFDRRETEQYQWIVFFKDSSNLGRLLVNKLNAAQLTNGNRQEQPANHPTSTVRSPQSFDEVQDRNLILKANKFNDIRHDNKNYETFCKIVDVFPLNYSTSDLIYLACTYCNHEDSIRNLFDLDVEGVRNAANLFQLRYS